MVSAVGGAIVWGVDTVWANTIGRGQDEDGGNEGLIEQVGEGAVAIGKAIGSKVTEGIGSVKGFLAKNANIKAIWSTSIWAT